MQPAFAGRPLEAAFFAVTVGVWLPIELRLALQCRTDAKHTDRYSLLVVRLSVAGGILLAGVAHYFTFT